jgi:hypothetical protein
MPDHAVRRAVNRGMKVRALRISLAAVVVTVAVVAPTVPASAAALRNAAPVVVSAGTANPTTACALGTSRPLVRGTTPTLTAVLRDADAQSVSATFRVLDARGRVVWAPPATAPQTSGSQHAVVVPDGRLADAGTYTWAVAGRDSAGRWSLPKLCQFTVDAVAPAEPVVTPVAGEPAVYLEDATSGGVGLRGSFDLTDESSDVVSYQYSVDDGSLSSSVPATAARISVTPTSSGPHSVSVAAVDAAGNLSALRLYRFTVAAPVTTTAGGVWLLDEGAGSVGAESAGGPALALTPSTTWTAGALAEVAGRATDRALLLDQASDGAQTTGAVTSTSGSFTVSAFARLDAPGTAGTVLSQDGAATSAFTLGYTTADCPGGTASCWAFSMSATDSASSVVAVSRSVSAVQPGSWVYLAGVHDAVAGQVSLYVCTLGTKSAPGNLVPVAAAPQPFVAPWASSGAFRVGDDFAGSAPFLGAVSAVRVVDGVAATLSTVRQRCSAGS